MASWRSIIMPREHGVWGLLAAAALVGLPLGDHLAGLPLLTAALAAVLARQAATAEAGWRSAVVVVGASSLALGLLLLSAVLAADTRWIPWLAAASLPAGLGVWLSSRRSWFGSAAAGVAFAALAGAIATAGGSKTAVAAAAAAVLAGHLILIVPLVRAQTRKDPQWGRLAIELHVIALLLSVGCWAAGLLPPGIPLLFAFSLARAVLLVDKQTPMSSVTPARIGSQELIWMPVVAAAIVMGLRMPVC